jgi:amphi-Trp domain-containing protein
MKKNILIKNKSLKSNEEVAKMLHTIADRIAEKKIRFENGEQETEIVVPENMVFTVKAHNKQLRRKGPKHKISLNIHWMEKQNQSVQLEVK